MQKYADQPNNPNPDPRKNNNFRTYNPSEPFYNPSHRGPIFVNPHETFAEKLERLTDTRVIFPGDGNNDGGGNNYNNQKLKKQSTPFVYAQIELRSTTDIKRFDTSIKEYFKIDLVFYYKHNHFYWKKNQKKFENFNSLADAITYASQQKTFQGYLPITTIADPKPDHKKIFTTPIPSKPFDQIKKNDWFILWITTPNTQEHKKLTLVIALLNSRLRDLKEGLYAILSHFNYRLAQELSRKEIQDESVLLEKAEPYLTQKNIATINQILKEPGDKNYLEKLKNSEIKPHKYVQILQILLQLYAIGSTGRFFYTLFKNKKIPSFPNNFLDKSLFFANIFGNGLLVKNIFNQIYQWHYPKKR